MSDDITSVTPPADMLAALKAYLSPDATFDVYRVAAGGPVLTRALIGKAGHIIVYLVPANTVLVVGNLLPDGVSMPSIAGASLAAANDNSITPCNGCVTLANKARLLATLNTYLGTSVTNFTYLGCSGLMPRTTPATIITESANVGIVVVYPSGFVYQEPLREGVISSSSLSSSYSTLIYLGIVLVLALALGAGAWFYLRNRRSKIGADA
jgi:hypothetical protein